MAERKGGYGVVYQDVMRSKHLSPEAKAIYAYLSSIAGSGSECYPSRDLMCEELGMSKNRLDKHLSALVACGVVEKRRDCSGNLKGRNIYKITHETEVAEDLKRIFRGLENKGLENKGLENKGLENEYSNNNSTNNNSLNNTICSEPETASELSGIKIILNDKSYYDVPMEKITLWKETYPSVDVEQELRKMAAWSDASPAKRKTRRGIVRFINSWLSREQDRGPRVQQYNGRGMHQYNPPCEAEMPDYLKCLNTELTPEEKAILGEE